VDNKIRLFVMRGLALLLVALFAAAAFRWLIPALIPFGIAFAVSALIRPASKKLGERLFGGVRLWSVVLIILSTVLLGGILWYVGSALLGELREAVQLLGKAIGDEESPLRRSADKLMSSVRAAGFEEMLSGFDAGQVLGKAASEAAGLVGGILTRAPSFFLFFIVMILSLFYFSCDFPGIKKELVRYLPKGSGKMLSEAAGIGLRALGRFARAYLLLFSITLCVLTAGFFFIGVDYPLLAGAMTALVDLLPVLGVGTVLFPWSLILLISGKTAKGIWMLVLLCFMYVLRQMLEPRIVGAAAGVHPIAVLFSVYLGFRLFGVGGMLAAPLVLNGVCVFLEEKRKKVEGEVDKKDSRSYNCKE